MLMEKLKREDLYTLEDYSRMRAELRADVMAHKRNRQVQVGPNATLHFEDRKTIQYQVQEMLHVERIFESEGIEDELSAYNPLIPDGDNWKATFMLEFEDPAERVRRLSELVGVEDTLWVRVGDREKVFAIADEDLERDTEEKTSSVHFVRFQLTPEMIGAVREGSTIAIGIDHPAYTHSVDPVPENVRASLAADLDA